jgi:hypothetical protein
MVEQPVMTLVTSLDEGTIPGKATERSKNARGKIPRMVSSLRPLKRLSVVSNDLKLYFRFSYCGVNLKESGVKKIVRTSPKWFWQWLQ